MFLTRRRVQPDINLCALDRRCASASRPTDRQTAASVIFQKPSLFVVYHHFKSHGLKTISTLRPELNFSSYFNTSGLRRRCFLISYFPEALQKFPHHGLSGSHSDYGMPDSFKITVSFNLTRYYYRTLFPSHLKSGHL